MLKIPAPAKINIGLQVGNMRYDGYHPIQTFMQTVELYDWIYLDDAEEFVFSTMNFKFPADEKNLCVKAYEAFSQAVGIDKQVSIKLEKNIPMGAGLGGGSSDAAAVIWGLNRLWSTGLSNTEMADIGGRVGSDVPFFLAAPDGAGFCSGRGEIVEQMDPVFNGWALIVYDGIYISTKEAYRLIDINLTNCKKIINLRSFVSHCFPAQKGLIGVTNDFFDIVRFQHPVLQEIALSLERQGSSYSSLSGSGSAVFGLFNTESEAKAAKLNLPPYRFIYSAATPAPNHHRFATD